jgi:hypothetical protein
MAHSPLPQALAELPPELIQAVAREAARDADHVAAFLDQLGLRPTGDRASPPPPRLPAWFLLEVAAGLRLWQWEHNGLRLHLEGGLPPAREALHGVFRRLAAAAGDPASGGDTPLSARVLGLFAERLAWSGRSDLDGDLLLGDADEDELVGALEDLIWTHRAALRRARCDRGGGAS